MHRIASPSASSGSTVPLAATERRAVVEHVCGPVRFRERDGPSRRPLGRLIDVPTFDGALARIGGCDAEWRDGIPRRETRWVVVDLIRLELSGAGTGVRGVARIPAATLRIEIDPRTGRRIAMRERERIASLASIEASVPPCRLAQGHAWRAVHDAPTVLDDLDRCPCCGWSRERIDAVETLLTPDGSLGPSLAIGDGLDPEGSWERYLHHSLRLDDAQVRARVGRRHRAVVRLPARRSGDVHRRWIDLPPGRSANDGFRR